MHSTSTPSHPQKNKPFSRKTHLWGNIQKRLIFTSYFISVLRNKDQEHQTWLCERDAYYAIVLLHIYIMFLKISMYHMFYPGLFFLFKTINIKYKCWNWTQCEQIIQLKNQKGSLCLTRISKWWAFHKYILWKGKDTFLCYL